MYGLNEHGRQEAMPAAVRTLSNNALVALSKHYPHVAEGWHLTVDQHGGILQVRNLLLNGKWGFVMRIRAIDPEMNNIVSHAGELLERYRVSREKLDPKHAIEIVQDIPRNRIGDTIHDE